MTWLRKIFIVALFLSSWGAQAQVLKIQGAPPGTVESLQKKYPQLFDKSTSLAEIDELVRQLMTVGNFEKVTALQQGNGDVVIEVQVLRRLTDVQIRGNKSFSTNSIKDLLDLKTGQNFERGSVTEAGERLKEFYGENGFYSTVVEVKFATLPDNQIQVVFEIDERSPCRIESLEFVTENQGLREYLHRRVKRFLKRPLTTAAFQDLQSAIQESLLFERYLLSTVGKPEINYNDDRTQAHLKYLIRNPFRYDHYFVGNSQLSVFDIVKTARVDEIQATSGDPSAEVSDRIKQRYLQSGFPHVQIKTTESEDPKAFKRAVTINIDEGPRVKITGFEVTGRISRPSKYYSQFIKENSSALLERGYYYRKDVELGYQNLINELRNQGYLKARVQSLRTEYVNKKAEAKIRIVLDEGPLTQVRKIDFKGIKAFSEIELSSVVAIKVNAPLRLSALEDSINRLQNFYRSRGYLEMHIKNLDDQLVHYNDRGTEANVTFDIVEGPQVIVSSIAIEGNSFTKDYVVLREIDFEIGDVLTPEKIEESRTRLNRMGIFSQVAINTVEEGTKVSQRTVKISVGERDPGLFKIGVGADSERELTLRQFTALSYNNIAGTAQGVSGRLELGYNPTQVQYLTHRLTAGYYRPFFGNSRTRGRINATRQKQVTDYEEKLDLIEVTDSSRIDFLLERDLTSTTKLTWRLWSIDSVKTFGVEGKCDDSTSVKCKSELDQIVTIGPTLDVDFRDSPFVPTRGSHFRWSLFYSSPDLGSSRDVEFAKTEASYSYLWNLGSPHLVWANQLRGGYVTNLSTIAGSKVPESHIFFLGGTSSIRGFSGSGSIERIPNAYEFPSNEVIVNEDSHYYLLRSEFRYPIYGVVGGVLFYDGGLVNVTGYEFEKPYRHSAGFGIRFNTPVGPVSLDMGFKLDRKADRKEDPWRVHFSIGTF